MTTWFSLHLESIIDCIIKQIIPDRGLRVALEVAYLYLRGGSLD